MMNRRWENKLAFSYLIFQQTVIEIGQCGFDAENIGFIFWTVCAYIEFSGSSIHRNLETVCVSETVSVCLCVLESIPTARCTPTCRSWGRKRDTTTFCSTLRLKYTHTHAFSIPVEYTLYTLWQWEIFYLYDISMSFCMSYAAVSKTMHCGATVNYTLLV